MRDPDNGGLQEPIDALEKIFHEEVCDWPHLKNTSALSFHYSRITLT
jgi:hypothetical protein